VPERIASLWVRRLMGELRSCRIPKRIAFRVRSPARSWFAAAAAPLVASAALRDRS